MIYSVATEKLNEHSHLTISQEINSLCFLDIKNLQRKIIVNTNPPSSVYRIPPRPSVAPPPIPYNEEKSDEPLHSSHQLKKSTAFHLQLFDGGLRESANRRGLEMASFKTLGNQSSFRDYREQGHHVESVANGRLWQGNEKGSRDCFPAGEAVDREEEVIVGDDEYVEYLLPYSEEDEATTHEYVQYLSLYTSEEDPDTDEPKLKVLPILNREDTELSKIKASLNIAENTLNREKRLGEGQFGEVIKGTWRPAKEVCLPVAIKEIKSQDLQLE